jgi:hypothetical protein
MLDGDSSVLPVGLPDYWPRQFGDLTSHSRIACPRLPSRVASHLPVGGISMFCHEWSSWAPFARSDCV